MVKHCYIHIPFCKKICSYCDFCKLLYYKEMVNDYLDTLQEEIQGIYQNEELETIYIGGGTPSCLSLEQLEKLLSIVSKLKKSKNIEYTIEGNFESTTEEKLKLYQKYGINRLSFGIESINEENLKFLGRTLNKDKVRKIITIARKLGFSNINLDLMYALPTEDEKVLMDDLNYILSLNPEHISTYSLIIEDHTKLKIDKVKNISEELDEEMYQMIIGVLQRNNYIHYEISNFSKENYESRHNLCYWRNKEYYGFGLGASSYLKNTRITNTRSWKDYQNQQYTKEIEILTEKDKMEYEIILNLRTKTGIDLDLWKRTYHKSLLELYDYQELVQKQYLLEEQNHLFIPENKWYISNEIIVKLLGCEQNG